MVGSNIKTMCVRFNLDKPLHRKAFDFLQEQSQFSNTQAVVVALIDYFENQEREDRLVEKIVQRLSGVAPISAPIISEKASQHPSEVDVSDIDFDFLGG